jgi:hypothetical protein
MDRNLNQMVDEMLHDVSAAADDAHAQLQRSADEKHDQFKEKLAFEMKHMHQDGYGNTQKPTVTSTRFPNVILGSSFRRSPNPYDTTASLPDTTYRRSSQVY